MTPFFFNDSREIADLFDRNAFYYDRVNTVICLGQDALWRRWAAKHAVAAAMRVERRTPPAHPRRLRRHRASWRATSSAAVRR